jgi:hypothetical protein
MGIRFACHVCAKQLNIKQELAGKRGICPACSSKFRIPLDDAKVSLPIEDSPTSAPARATEDPLPATPSAQPQVQKPDVQKPEVEIDLLSSDPAATWYVRPPSGGQYGPADGDVLRTWISEGRVAATALLWRDGWSNWRPAKEVLPGLSAGSAPHEPLSAAAPAAPAPPQASELPAAVTATLSDGPSAATPGLSGRADVGTERRAKNNQRILWIGVLLAIAITLVALLAYLVIVNS